MGEIRRGEVGEARGGESGERRWEGRVMMGNGEERWVKQRKLWER